MAQYDLSIPTAFAGLKADSGYDRVESFAATETIYFGRAVQRNSTNPTTQVDVCDSTSAEFRGVALQQHNQLGYYSQYDTVNVLRQGSVWVDGTGTIACDASAYVDVSGGTGKFTSTPTGVFTGGKFRTATTGDGLVKLEINLP